MSDKTKKKKQQQNKKQKQQPKQQELQEQKQEQLQEQKQGQEQKNQKNKQKKQKKKKGDLDDFTREAAEQVEKHSKSFFRDFKKFIAKGNIIDLAVAVVIGSAFNKIVSALVNNIIMPLTGRLIASQDLATLKWVLVEGVEADEANGIEAISEVAVTYGVFLQAIIDFLVVSLCIFCALRVIMRIKDAAQRKERRIAEEKAKEEAARLAAEEEERKRLAEEEAARLEQIKNDFIEDVAVQADVLNEIKDIMLRMEEKLGKGT